MGENCRIAISRKLYREVEKRIAGSQFDSVDHYIEHVIREMLAVDENEYTLMTREQQDQITKRLRDLGYFD